MERLKPMEMKCLVQGHAASPQFLPEDICQFVWGSVWRAFSFPELMDYLLINVQKNAQRSFLYSPLWERLLFLLSGNPKSILGRTILRCVWSSQEFQDVSVSSPIIAAGVTAVMPSCISRHLLKAVLPWVDTHSVSHRWGFWDQNDEMSSPSALPCPPQGLL